MRKELFRRGGAWLLTLALILSLLPTSVLAAGNTIYTDMSVTEAGDGSEAKPFKNFEDAVNAAGNGDTIVIRNKAILNESSSGVPGIMDKDITIQPEGDSAALFVRTAGIVLGADVTMNGIELNFQNKYHNAIFVNGHRFTAINVTRGSGSREVHLFAGTIGAATGLNFTATAGTNAAFTLQNSEFGNIYAGSVAENSSVTMNVDISNSKAIGNIYGSGAQEYKPDEGSWFDMTEPDPPVADTTYTAGDATVTVDGSTTLAVDGSGAKSMNVIVKNGNNRPLTLSGVTALTTQGGKVKVASVNENAHVTLLNSAELDLSNAANGTDVKLATLSGSGKLILGKDHLLTIASTISGTYTLETPGYSANTSGEAAYDHTYIKAFIGDNATVNFVPHSTQDTMKLEKIPSADTTWIEWKTTAAPTVPTTVSKFETAESSVSTDSDALQNGGITIPVTWESSDPASLFKSLSAIPFHYAVTYNGATVESVDTENGGMYESSVTFANGTSIWITAGDASEQDNLPDRLEIVGNLTAGVYTITIYAPKADDSKIQLPLTLMVTDGTEAATATELTAPAADTQYTENDSVTLTAKVTSNGQPVTRGEVAFWINGTALGTQGQIKAVTVSADGMASTTVNASAANHFKINETNTVKANYRTVPGAYAASESGEITIRVNEAANVTANLQLTPSSIEKKIQLTNNTANLKWDAGTNTLTVLKDFTTKMPIVFTGFGAPVTLDLNGHTVTTDVPGYGNDRVVEQYGLILRDGSAVTIKDSSEGKNGAFVSTWSTAYLDSGSSLTLESGRVQGLGKGDGSGVISTSGRGDKVTLNIKGGELVIAGTASPYQPASGYCAFMKNADVIMSGGVLRADGDKDMVQGDAAYARGIRGMSDTTIQVTGGEFQNFKGPAIVTYGATATATVTGMTLESDWRTVEVTGGSTVTLSNCTVKQTDAVRPQGLTGNEEVACAIEVDNSTLNLNNTIVTGVNTSDGAIYGRGRSTLNITGGSVNSTGKSAIEISGSTTATLTDVTVKNSASGFPAIYASLNNKLYVTNGSIDATAGNSVTLQGTQVAEFTNVTITNEGKGWAGIFANAYFNNDNTIAKSSIVTIKGGSITAQDGCGLWIRNRSSVTLQENAVVTNHAEDGQSTYPAVYVREGSTLAATGGSITAAKSSNAINIDDVVNATADQPGCSVKLTNVAVSSTDSTWHAIYAGQNNDLTISGGTVTAGTAGNAVRGYQAVVTVKDQATLVGSGVNETIHVNTNSALHVANSTIRNSASDGIYVGEGSNGTVTNTTVEVQRGYGIRAVGSGTATAAITLNTNKVTVRDGMALYAENGTITVNSGTYYAGSNYAITGTAPYGFIINGGYFHGSADTLEGTRADGVKLTLPTGKVLSNANITAQERTDNDLGSDYWWRLAARTYTLSFETNGATTKPDDQQLEEGATPTKPVDPTKPGYRFLGWKNGDTIVDLDNFTMPANHVTLTAAWEAKTYTIRFDKNGQQDATGTVNDQTYVYDTADAKLTAEVFASDTKDFLGWSLSNTATTASYTKESPIDDALKAAMVNSVGDTVTLYAVWKDKPVGDVTVTFDAQTNGGELADGSAATQTGKPGTNLTLPSVKDRIGFNFTGWWTASADGTQITEPAVFPATDTTYYAQWIEKDAVEVTFTSGDGAWDDHTTGIKNASTRPGSAATVPGTVSRPGYTFDGWQSDNNAYRDLLADETQTPEIQEGQTVHYTPKWKAITYIIRFDANGRQDAEGTVPDLAYAYDAQNAVLHDKAFTSLTKKFLGWSLSNTAGAASYQPGEAIGDDLKAAMLASNGSITLYAIWTDKDAVTMTFNAGEGTFADGSKEKTVSVRPGQQNTLPAAPTRDGYIFDGWVSSNAADYPDLEKDAVQTPVGIDGKNVTYTAKWVGDPKPATTHTVTFQSGSNGSFATVNDPLIRQSVESGKTVTGVPGITANTNYRFDGWQIGGAGTVYTRAQVMAMAITKDTVLIASYTHIGGGSSGGGGGGGSTSYTIKASANAGGSISPKGTVSVSRGGDKTFTITASEGYKISDVLVDGKSIGTVSRYTFENVRASHTIKAVFEKNGSGVADPEETGIGGWLNTQNHVAFITGFADGSFGPNRQVTRAQVAQMLYRLLKEQNVPVTVSFPDVPADAWYAKAVNSLASLGIITGKADGRFDPNAPITRAQFVAMIGRFAKVNSEKEVSSTDVSRNDWFYPHLRTAVNYGWINGKADGSFAPNANITRAEVAVIVCRMLARSADERFVDTSTNLRRYSDVDSGYWAYYAIMEASNSHSHTMASGEERWNGLTTR